VSWADELARRLASGGNMQVDPQDPPVYWGSKRGAFRDKISTFAPLMAPDAADRLKAAPVGQAREKITLSEAQGQFYSWDEGERRAWGEHLANLGLIDPEDVADYGILRDQWNAVIGEAANFTTAGKKLDPWDVASLIAGSSDDIAARKAASERAKPFSGTKTSTSKTVDLTDPATGKALVNDTLSRYLGRAASDEEIAEFIGVLNNAERSNPATTQTATTYQDGDAVSQSSTTSGGITAAGRQQMIADEAMESPEYGAYQAAATYLPALFGAIGAPV